MTDPRIVAAPITVRRSKRALAWLLAAGVFMIVISPVVLFAGAGNPPCQAATPRPLPAGAGGVDRDRLRAAVGCDERERRDRHRPGPDRR